MNPFQRLGGALDTLWSALDPDEPLFCECSTGAPCADCALAGPVDPVVDWSLSAPPIAAS